MPFVIDLTIPEDNRQYFKVISHRLVAYMMAKDMEQANEEIVRQMVSSIFEYLAQGVKPPKK